MATSCFFCLAKHGLSERDYDMPLCADCRQMERFQILLLQQLCFIQTSLYEMQEVMGDKEERTTREVHCVRCGRNGVLSASVVKNAPQDANFGCSDCYPSLVGGKKDAHT